MLLISKQNELWSRATSQIAEDGKTILNLSYFFKIDCDLPEILCFKAVWFSFRPDFYEILKSRKFAFMLLISERNELGSCATSQIVEHGKTIQNLS